MIILADFMRTSTNDEPPIFRSVRKDVDKTLIRRIISVEQVQDLDRLNLPL